MFIFIFDVFFIIIELRVVIIMERRDKTLSEKEFGKRDLQHIKKIKFGGNNKNLIQIKYRDKKGNLSLRKVEPYKINGEDFWGYDPAMQGIRRFKIRGIRSIKNTTLSYEPRWQIEMDKVAYYRDMIYKQAALKSDITLHPHQIKSVNRPGDSVVYAHGVGSGKTLTGIARFEKLKSEGKAKKALVVVPAGLRDNFATSGVAKFTDSRSNVIGNKEEIRKGTYHAIDPNADYNIISYEMFRSNPELYLKQTGADTVITDESHRGKNEDTMTTEALKKTRHLYKNYIGLTGSIVSNDISDILPLVDVASNGSHSLGKNKEEFSKKYLKRSTSKEYRGLPEKRVPVVGFNNKKDLTSQLAKYVDYIDNDEIREVTKMPKKNVNLVKVPISRRQAKIYVDMLQDNPKVRKMIVSKRLETLKDEEVAKAYNKLIEERKLMNSVGSVHPGISLSESAKITPKTKKLLDDLQEHLKTTPDGQALLFSHLINGGTDVLETGLKDRGIDYGRFLGKGNKGVTEESRQRDVVDFNKGNKKVMVISGAGGEGISLNDTTWEGVLDPHFNPEKMKQMEARGIRTGGLSRREPKDRQVAVNRYLATMPKTLGLFKSKYRTPDEFIYEISQHKDKQNQLLFDLLKKNREESQSGQNKRI
jgi:SNF2 family DNA or RNA helicase